MNSLKLSETVEKGKHPEKFGLAENKAGPEREYILQVGIKWSADLYSTSLCRQSISKSVEVKQEWCTEVNKLLLQQLEKLSMCSNTCVTMALGVLYIEQTKAHDSGSTLTETLPPPMTHVVELPSRFHKHKKTVKRYLNI